MTVIVWLVRSLRKRWVLGFIFIFSLIYFLASMSLINFRANWADVGSFVNQNLSQPNWQYFFSGHNGSIPTTCRNSVQGRTRIADERGYVCDRIHLQPGGCCDSNGKSTTQFSCGDCLSEAGCCLVYEHCVSCCMLPDKQLLLKSILRRALETYNPIYSSVTDHFELCLTKCRTSSTSVQHENSYKDPKYKYCYKEQTSGDRNREGT